MEFISKYFRLKWFIVGLFAVFFLVGVIRALGSILLTWMAKR